MSRPICKRVAADRGPQITHHVRFHRRSPSRAGFCGAFRRQHHGKDPPAHRFTSCDALRNSPRLFPARSGRSMIRPDACLTLERRRRTFAQAPPRRRRTPPARASPVEPNGLASHFDDGATGSCRPAPASRFLRFFLAASGGRSLALALSTGGEIEGLFAVAAPRRRCSCTRAAPDVPRTSIGVTVTPRSSERSIGLPCT